MNSLELLSKHLDALSIQPRQESVATASPPSPVTPPSRLPPPPSPSSSKIRQQAPIHRFLILRLLISLWQWFHTQWAIFVVLRRLVTGADLDLDDETGEGASIPSSSSSHGLGDIEEEVTGLPNDSEPSSSSRSPNETLWDHPGPLKTKIRQKAVHQPAASTSPPPEISLNYEYTPPTSPGTASSSLAPSPDADHYEDALTSPSLEFTPPTPDTKPSRPLPSPSSSQVLLLNPSYAPSFLITNPKTLRRRGKDPESAGTSTPDYASTPQRTLTPTPLRSRQPFPTKTLVLDLDETLIHSTSRTPTASYGQGLFSAGGLGFGIGSGGIGFGIWGGKKTGPGHMVEVVLGGRSTLYHVYKRPFVDYFLKKVCTTQHSKLHTLIDIWNQLKVSTWYTLVIFTASMQEYADPVIDWLDAGRGILARRLFREV